MSQQGPSRATNDPDARGVFKPIPTGGSAQIPDVMGEKHFTVPQLSRWWGYSQSVIRSWLVEKPRPGVLRHTHQKRGKREYVSLRISESAAIALYAEKCGV
jgi:hypothetical protein